MSNRNQGQEEKEVQDSAREEQLRKVLGLQPSGEGRMGADAIDEEENPFELKSTTKNSVTTARDVGPHTLKRWRGRYWVCAKGRNTTDGFIIDELYFLSPSMLDDWFTSIEGRFRNDLQILDKAAVRLSQGGWGKGDLERLRYLVERGLTLNNPKIPWHYVQEHGVRITEDHAANLRALVRENPLPGTRD